MTYVIGHKNPDTDSVCSAIVYAWYLSEFNNMQATAVIAGDINNETEFVLNYFNVAVPDVVESLPAGSSVVLVDTNNPEELIAGIEDCEIIEIIDHHKLSGLKTLSPLNITMRKYGSVPTVMWEIMQGSQDNFTPSMAGLMLAPIISDTLKFTSPTTTGQDTEVANTLASIAVVNIDDFASAMFAAKSDLTGKTPKDILLTDHKNFEFGGNKYKIAVLETTSPNFALDLQTQILNEADLVAIEEDLTGVFFFVIDIIASQAYLFESTNAALNIAAKKAFSKDFENGVMVLPGIVSRKSQIAPMLGEVLS